ncbi:MAG: hypothetical protein PHF42_13855 [Pseudomonas sp.]|nr:hypothetical protein [Pseudomonas sp.]
MTDILLLDGFAAEKVAQAVPQRLLSLNIQSSPIALDAGVVEYLLYIKP